MVVTLATALTLRLCVSLGSVAGSCNPFAMKGGNGGPLVRRAEILRSFRELGDMDFTRPE